jgi:hypothetical protein
MIEEVIPFMAFLIYTTGINEHDIRSKQGIRDL